MISRSDPPIGSGYLPHDAQVRLKAAAATKITPEDPTARIRAINSAEAWVKATYPQYFRKDA